MQQNRKRGNDMPNRSSNMEPAEGSRETVMNSGSDLGTSSDRAMFDERLSGSEREGSNDSSSERGTEPGGERDRTNSGGITNRPLDVEQSEQDQLPPRGHSQSDDSQSER